MSSILRPPKDIFFVLNGWFKMYDNIKRFIANEFCLDQGQKCFWISGLCGSYELLVSNVAHKKNNNCIINILIASYLSGIFIEILSFFLF